MVSQALAAGRIVPADRDIRLGQIAGAQTVGDLDLVVRDLRAAPAEPPGPPRPALLTNPAERIRPPGSTSPEALAAAVSRLVAASPGRVPLGLKLLPLAISVLVIGVVVSAVIGVARQVTGGAGPRATTTLVPDARASRPPADVLSVKGFGAMLAAVRRTTGSTKAYDAVLYPGYGVLQLPVDRGTRHQELYRWDGALSPVGTLGTAQDRALDLSAVDPRILVRLSERARRNLVDDATSWYVILHDRRAGDASVIYAYASNAYGEGGYLSATITGKVTRRITW